MKYVLSEAADRDLLEIFRYTTEFWGRRQAKTYVESLRGTMRQLAKMPLMGSHFASVGERKIFRFLHGRHVIYYQQDEGGIFIIGIDHQSRMLMDFQ